MSHDPQGPPTARSVEAGVITMECCPLCRRPWPKYGEQATPDQCARTRGVTGEMACLKRFIVLLCAELGRSAPPACKLP